MEFELVCGIEFELGYNPSLLSFEIGDYHTMMPTWRGDFIFERDGSISSQWGTTVEIISKPFLLKDYKQILNNFQSIFKMQKKNGLLGSLFGDENKNPMKEMKELIEFNGSTGAHVHVSMLRKDGKSTNINYREKNFEFGGTLVPVKSLATFKFLDKFTKKLCKKVEAEMPSIYPNWQEGLFRSQARKINDDGQYRREKYHEWNLRGSREHMEYRSFHLHYIDNWENFFKIWDCFFGVLKDFFEEEMEQETPFLHQEKIDFAPSDISDSVVINHQILLPNRGRAMHEQVIFGATERTIAQTIMR